MHMSWRLIASSPPQNWFQVHGVPCVYPGQAIGALGCGIKTIKAGPHAWPWARLEALVSPASKALSA
jgi:hypothetical protein